MKKYPYYTLVEPCVYEPVDDGGCPHWRQVAGQFDLMETYAEDLWKVKAYFYDKKFGEKVAELLNNSQTKEIQQK